MGMGQTESKLEQTLSRSTGVDARALAIGSQGVRVSPVDCFSAKRVNAKRYVPGLDSVWMSAANLSAQSGQTFGSSARLVLLAYLLKDIQCTMLQELVISATSEQLNSWQPEKSLPRQTFVH